MTEVESRPLGSTGDFVSALTLGTMTFGRETSPETAVAIIDEYMGQGGTTLDIADVYAGGQSELIVGKAMSDRREDVFLIGKVGLPAGGAAHEKGTSRRRIMTACQQSLDRLATSHYDLLLIHCWDPNTPEEDLATTLANLVDRGVARYVGLSNFPAGVAGTIAGILRGTGGPQIAAVQSRYSLLERDIEHDLLPWAARSGIATMAWSPLAGGLLTAKYNEQGDRRPPGEHRMYEASPAAARLRDAATAKNLEVCRSLQALAEAHGLRTGQLALAWLLSQDGVTNGIIGVRTVAQLRELLELPATVDPGLIAEAGILTEPELRYPWSVYQQLGSAWTGHLPI